MLEYMYNEDALKMMLFEKMMRPRINQWRKENNIVSSGIHASHRRLVEKYFVIEDGKVKMTQGDPKATLPIESTQVFREGMTKEQFDIEEKEWMAKEKTMLL